MDLKDLTRKNEINNLIQEIKQVEKECKKIRIEIFLKIFVFLCVTIITIWVICGLMYADRILDSHVHCVSDIGNTMVS